LCGDLPGAQAALPFRLADLAVLVVPEAAEYVRVVEQHADASGEFLPHQSIDALVPVQRAQLFQKRAKGFLFGQTQALVDFRGVGGVEGNPQENEAPVRVLGLLGRSEERRVGKEWRSRW